MWHSCVLVCADRRNTPRFDAWNLGFHGKTRDERARSHARNLMSWHNSGRHVCEASMGIRSRDQGNDQRPVDRRPISPMPRCSFLPALSIMQPYDHATLSQQDAYAHVRTGRVVAANWLTDWLTQWEKVYSSPSSCCESESKISIS